jgi:hypothetical protein
MDSPLYIQIEWHTTPLLYVQNAWKFSPPLYIQNTGQFTPSLYIQNGWHICQLLKGQYAYKIIPPLSIGNAWNNSLILYTHIAWHIFHNYIKRMNDTSVTSTYTECMTHIFGSKYTETWNTSTALNVQNSRQFSLPINRENGSYICPIICVKYTRNICPLLYKTLHDTSVHHYIYRKHETSVHLYIYTLHDKLIHHHIYRMHGTKVLF